MSSDRPYNDDRGQPGEGTMVQPRYTMQIQQHGRTVWDVLHVNRRSIAVGVASAVSVIAVAVCVHVYGTDAVVALVADNWPVLLAPLVGWILGDRVARSVYKPPTRMLVQLDTENHMIAVIAVPDERFRSFDQRGNNVVYHSPRGHPVYLVRGFDPWSGLVDYGWVHTSDPLVVMTRESAYNRWKDTLDRVLEENLSLMHHPHTIGLGYARGVLRRHLDDISEALGLMNQDYDGHDTIDIDNGNGNGSQANGSDRNEDDRRSDGDHGDGGR